MDYIELAKQLSKLIKGVCSECGSGSDDVVDFIIHNDSDQQLLVDACDLLADDCREELMRIILASDYDIFVPWYKTVLFKMAFGEKPNFFAKDLYEYYKESFDVTELLELFRR